MSKECDCRSFIPLLILPIFLLIIINSNHNSPQQTSEPSKPIDIGTPILQGLEHIKSYGYGVLTGILLLVFAIDYKLYERRMYMPIVGSVFFSGLVVMWFLGDPTQFSMTNIFPMVNGTK